MNAYPDTIPLVEIASILIANYGSSPSYDRLYKAVLGGCIRATRPGRSYHVDRAEIPAIAQHFRLSTVDAGSRS